MHDQLPQLTGVRGLAALQVMIFHLNPLPDPDIHYNVTYTSEDGTLRWLVNGDRAVITFFMLSGFLMGFLYAPRPFTARECFVYFRARISRVVPLYLFGLCIWSWLHQSWWQTLSVGFTLRIGPGHLWTVGVELQFYLLFALLWSASSARSVFVRQALPCALAILYFLALVQLLGPLLIAPLAEENLDDAFTAGAAARTTAAIVARTPWSSLPSWFTQEWYCCQGVAFCFPSYAPIFLIGAYMGSRWEAVVLSSPRRSSFERLARWLGPIFLLCNLLSLSPLDYWQRRFAHFAPNTNPYNDAASGHYWSPRLYVASYLDPYIHLSAAGLIASAAMGPPTLSWLLESRVMQYCGRISFGLYIYHHFGIQVLHITDFRGHFGEHAFVNILFIYWPLTFLAAHLSFEYFEKPLMAIARRRCEPSPSSHIPLAACARSYSRPGRAAAVQHEQQQQHDEIVPAPNSCTSLAAAEPA